MTERLYWLALIGVGLLVTWMFSPLLYSVRSLIKKENNMSPPNSAHDQLLRAQFLIRAGRYDEARAVLATINHPKAREWEQKMDALGYGVPDPFALSENEIIEISGTRGKSANKANKYVREWQSGGCFTRGCMLALAVGVLLVICGIFSVLGQAIGLLPDTNATRTVQAENKQSTQQAQIATAAILALTPSATPTSTSTPTLTFTPTNTLTITPLPTLDATQIIEATGTTKAEETRMAQSLATATAIALLPTNTPTLQPTLDWKNAPTTTYFITSPMANVRACASTQCQAVAQVEYRAPLSAVEIVSGESLGGDASWLHVNLGTSDGYVHNSVASLTEPPPPTATPKPTSTPKYGSLKNPYPSGSWLEFDDGRVRASRIIRPADSMVAGFNMFNSPPAAGAEYVLIWFEAYCGQQKCDPGADLDIRLIDSTQQIWGEKWLEVLEPDLDLMEGLEGSTLAGWQLFEFPIGRGIAAIQVRWPKWGDTLYVSP
jgi:hypothetical protein